MKRHAISAVLGGLSLLAGACSNPTSSSDPRPATSDKPIAARPPTSAPAPASAEAAPATSGSASAAPADARCVARFNRCSCSFVCALDTAAPMKDCARDCPNQAAAPDVSCGMVQGQCVEVSAKGPKGSAPKKSAVEP